MLPDVKPMMVYDGECGFCKKWITRWKFLTRDQVYYRPYQEIALQFPSIPISEFETAVKLITQEGEVFSGAEAVYRALAYVSFWKWLWFLYRKLPLFRWISDRAYGWVSSHRRQISQWTP